MRRLCTAASGAGSPAGGEAADVAGQSAAYRRSAASRRIAGPDRTALGIQAARAPLGAADPGTRAGADRLRGEGQPACYRHAILPDTGPAGRPDHPALGGTARCSEHR